MRRMLRRLYRAYVRYALPQPQCVRRFISRHGGAVDGGYAVEIGCGAAPFRDELCRSFAIRHYIATDIAPGDRTDLAADAAVLPFGDRSISLIAAFQVLQHVADARSFLAEAARVLGPGGKLLLSYPFMYGECDVRDHRRWTIEGMQRDCLETGFEVIEQQRIGGPAFMLTSFCVALIGHLIPGGRRSWRAGRTPLSVARLGLSTALCLLFHLLGWAALALDRLWPASPFYMGGIVLARRAQS